MGNHLGSKELCKLAALVRTLLLARDRKPNPLTCKENYIGSHIEKSARRADSKHTRIGLGSLLS